MGIVEQFSARQAKKVESQATMGDYDWEKYEQAQEPEKFPLPTGQEYSMEDMDEQVHDPWDMYYTYVETVALPQIEETQQVLNTLDRSIPGEMLPVPGDPVDLPKLYPQTVQQLGTIKDYLTEKLPSSPREVDEFFTGERERSQQERDEEVLQKIEEEGYPEEYEQMKQESPQSKETRRTVHPSIKEDFYNPEEYPSGRTGMTTAQLFASRQR